MAFEVQLLAGRLITAVMTSPLTALEIAAGSKKIITIMLNNPALQFVFATDVRQLGLVPPDVQAAITKMMQSDNPRIDYNALWANKRNQSSLLTFRLVRAIGNPKRQVFLSHVDLTAALQPHLTPVELVALQQFIRVRLAQKDM